MAQEPDNVPHQASSSRLELFLYSPLHYLLKSSFLGSPDRGNAAAVDCLRRRSVTEVHRLVLPGEFDLAFAHAVTVCVFGKIGQITFGQITCG